MKRLFALAAVLVGLLLTAGTSSAAVITTYTNQATWQAAAGGTVITENFSDGILVPGLSITFGTSLPGSISGGLYHDRGIFGTSGNPIWEFSPSISAFGGNWDLAGPGGQGTGLLFTVTFDDNTTQQVTPPLTISNVFNGGFFGFTSDTAIKRIDITADGQGGNFETFDADNFQFVQAIPEPVSLAVFGALTVGAFGVRRRLKTTA